MPEYAVSKLTGDRPDGYFPSFSGSGNSRPQWVQITVSPGFHSFTAFVEAHDEKSERAQRSRSNGLANRFIEVSLRRSSLGELFGPRRDPHIIIGAGLMPVSYTHLRAHETDSYLVCRLLLEKKKK